MTLLPYIFAGRDDTRCIARLTISLGRLHIADLLMRPEHSEIKAKTETRKCKTKTETETTKTVLRPRTKTTRPKPRPV